MARRSAKTQRFALSRAPDQLKIVLGQMLNNSGLLAKLSATFALFRLIADLGGFGSHLAELRPFRLHCRPTIKLKKRLECVRVIGGHPSSAL
jgi:hypothetical protein